MAAETFSIDELARLSDEEAVRGASNRSILKSLRWALRFFAVISIVRLHALSTFGSPDERPILPLVLGVLNLLVTFVLLAGFRRLTSREKGVGKRLGWFEPVARLLLNQPRGVSLTFLVIQLWIILYFATYIGDAMPWISLFPYALLFFRFAPAERFAMHAMFLLSAVAGWLIPLILDMSNGRFDHVIAATVANSIALGIGLYLSRRSGRSFLSEWRDARDRAREQIRMRQELEYAREIQMSMLPRETPALDWVDLATVSIPATEVGGDYYDFFFPAEDQLVLVSADVAGHGLGSGLVLSGVRSGLALLSGELDHPELVMGRLHGMLLKTTGTRMLVTMAMLSLDRTTFRARYSTAGHPPMLIRRQATGLVEEILRGSLPLGSALGGGFTVEEIAFSSGDIFVLHTDGVYEMRNAAGESYGLERLAAAIAAVTGETRAKDVRNAILRDVSAFRGSAPQEDDLTLVVARLIQKEK